MKRKLSMHIYLLLLLAFLFSSCSATTHYLGKTVRPGQQISLKGSAKQTEIWQSKDLTIHYNIVNNESFIDISGYVNIDDSISYTYPIVDYLDIYVYLLNEEGLAISKHAIRPRFSAFTPFPEKSEFSSRLPKSLSSSALAFGYSGKFREHGIRIRNRFVVDHSISHSPF